MGCCGHSEAERQAASSGGVAVGNRGWIGLAGRVEEKPIDPGGNLYTRRRLGRVGVVDLTVETFEPELRAALASYDRHVVCIEKIPEDCETTLRSLLEKAIKAFQTRAPDLRHGIALDRHVTVILSQTDGPRPLCAIYFNLFSPYAKRSEPRAQAAPGKAG